MYETATLLLRENKLPKNLAQNAAPELKTATSEQQNTKLQRRTT